MSDQQIKHETTIGDFRYEITSVPNNVSIPVLMRLFKALGPALADVLPGFEGQGKGKANLASMDVGVLAAGLKTLALSLSAEDVEYVSDALLKGATLSNDEGKTIPLTKEARNIHFQGRAHEFFQLVLFAVGANFSGFLGVLAPMRNVTKHAEPTPTQSE